MSRQRIPELDGLRGLAVMTVVLGHYCSAILPGVSFFNYASMGVDIFFVLSGFLIGGILLDGAWERPFLTGFFRRRAARILPLYVAVVAAGFLLQRAIHDAAWADDLFPAWTYATFTMNNWGAFHGVEPAPLLGPTWSLAVEEKFYCIAPFLLLLAPRKRLPLLLALLCAAAIAFRFLFRDNIYSVELVLPARMDSLVIGVGAALLWRSVDLKPWLPWLKGALLLVPLAYLPALVLLPARQMVLAHTVFALLTASYILYVMARPGPHGFFGQRWMGRLAAISYGVYLMHEPVDVLLTGLLLDKSIYAPGLDRIPVTLLALAVTLGLATLSWRFFERPILQWESRLGRRAGTPAAAGNSLPAVLSG